jgi:hypothetical protein
LNGKGRAAYIDQAQPAAMNQISLAVDKDMPELGRTYQRLLSATAHSGAHGLARMLTLLSPNEGHLGEALAAVNIDPRALTVELVVGPLTNRSHRRERHRVVHRLRHDGSPRSREPSAPDLGAYRPDQRADAIRVSGN